jgi:hypothetical protein
MEPTVELVAANRGAEAGGMSDRRAMVGEPQMLGTLSASGC